MLFWGFIFLFIIICVVLIIECFFVVYFLVFSVCEGSLGLSILVSIICSHGNDYFQFYVFFSVNVSLFVFISLTPLCIFFQFLVVNLFLVFYFFCLFFLYFLGSLGFLIVI